MNDEAAVEATPTTAELIALCKKELLKIIPEEPYSAKEMAQTIETLLYIQQKENS